MKIALQLTVDQIMAVCKMLELLEHLQPCVKPEDKLTRSIAFEVWDKFQTLKKKEVKNHSLFSEEKRKVTLKYYEAYGLLNIVRELWPLLNDDYTRVILNKLTNELHQKLV